MRCVLLAGAGRADMVCLYHRCNLVSHMLVTGKLMGGVRLCFALDLKEWVPAQKIYDLAEQPGEAAS